MAQAKNVAQGAYVTVIDSREITKPKLRVAAYVRVSSDSEDQINSYIAQVDFYTKYISQHEEKAQTVHLSGLLPFLQQKSHVAWKSKNTTGTPDVIIAELNNLFYMIFFRML